MTIWQRAIAIILLTVFTPASVLAGTPLRLCVGSDGHRAIEFVLTSQHHNDADVVTGAHCDGTIEHRPDTIPACSDAPLLSAVQKTSVSAKVKLSVPIDDLPPAVIPLPSLTSLSLSDFDQARRSAPSELRRDAHLDAIRTVVLLI